MSINGHILFLLLVYFTWLILLIKFYWRTSSSEKSKFPQTKNHLFVKPKRLESPITFLNILGKEMCPTTPGMEHGMFLKCCESSEKRLSAFAIQDSEKFNLNHAMCSPYT